MELAWETHSFGCNCISILKLKGVDGFSTNLKFVTSRRAMQDTSIPYVPRFYHRALTLCHIVWLTVESIRLCPISDRRRRVIQLQRE